MHSQKIGEPSLLPWLIFSKTGDIVSSQCTCAAGLGEACTHVAAILFALEYSGRQQKSVTDVLAYWIGPKSKKVFHKKIVDINFDVPQNLLRSGTMEEAFPDIVETPKIPEMTGADMEAFLTHYKSDGAMCVLHNFFYEIPSPNWPVYTNIYQEEYEHKTLQQLVDLADDIILIVSQETIKKVEEETRRQAQNNLWFLLRAGRITASNFSAVCRTEVSKPSISLLKRTCYPHLHKAIFKAGKFVTSLLKTVFNWFCFKVCMVADMKKKLWMHSRKSTSSYILPADCHAADFSYLRNIHGVLQLQMPSSIVSNAEQAA